MSITISRKAITIIAALAASILLLVITTGCAKFTEPFKDAPTAGHDGSPARVIEQPDGFSNAAEKCDGYGHLIITVYHGDSGYGSVAVVNDPRCGSLTAPLPFRH